MLHARSFFPSGAENNNKGSVSGTSGARPPRGSSLDDVYFVFETAFFFLTRSSFDKVQFGCKEDGERKPCRRQGYAVEVRPKLLVLEEIFTPSYQ